MSAWPSAASSTSVTSPASWPETWTRSPLTSWLASVKCAWTTYGRRAVHQHDHARSRQRPTPRPRAFGCSCLTPPRHLPKCRALACRSLYTMCGMGVVTAAGTPSARTANSSDLAADLIRNAILDGTLAAGRASQGRRAGVAVRCKSDARARGAAQAGVRGPGRDRGEAGRLGARRTSRPSSTTSTACARSSRATRRGAPPSASRPDQIALLRRELRALHQARRAASASSRPTWPRENKVFHDAILTAADDERLAAMARSVIHLPLVYKAYVWFTPRAAARLRALSPGDRRRARGAARATAPPPAMRKHVLEARDQLIGALQA